MLSFLHMEVLPNNSTCLELSIAMPGFSSSPSLQSSGEGAMKDLDLDINQIPSGVEEYGDLPRKKLRLTKEQSRVLEQSFKQNQTLNLKQKEGLADQLKLKPRQVEVWFQNRRARSKLKQTEMECEYLKKWFGSLSEQNRKLKKEVEELRGMKVGPPHSSHQLPAATLTMCPRCQHVTTTFLDKGPTADTTNSTTPTMSAKVQTIHSQHTSATS